MSNIGSHNRLSDHIAPVTMLGVSGLLALGCMYGVQPRHDSIGCLSLQKPVVLDGLIRDRCAYHHLGPKRAIGFCVQFVEVEIVLFRIHCFADKCQPILIGVFPVSSRWHVLYIYLGCDGGLGGFRA
jgi:hypothetical protein